MHCGDSGDLPGCDAHENCRTRITRGSLADYRTLAQFHYRSESPGAVLDVMRMELPGPTVVGRFLNRRDDCQLVGVLVRSLPSLSCRLRDIATNHRYGKLPPRERAVMLNREVRCISRVVIDPRRRGMGLAVQLVKHAIDHPLPGTRFTESLAAMGRVSPFFERAGMKRYERPVRSRADHARLIDALARVRIAPRMLASRAMVSDRIAALSETDHRWLDRELRRWRRASRRLPRDATNAMSMNDLLRQARDELLLSPVYFVYPHDAARACTFAVQTD
jgi:GNAT superfamily N-acetyltransferase